MNKIQYVVNVFVACQKVKQYVVSSLQEAELISQYTNDDVYETTISVVNTN
jgi:high-affinity Fe2+/Pb2+ permease